MLSHNGVYFLERRVKQNSLRMIRDRNFVIDEEEKKILKYDDNDFKNYYDFLPKKDTKWTELKKSINFNSQAKREISDRNTSVYHLSNVYKHEKDQNRLLLVLFMNPGNESIPKAVSDALVAFLDLNPQYTDVIIITDKRFNPVSRNNLSRLKNQLTLFFFKELVIDPTDHAFYSTHWKMENRQRIRETKESGFLSLISINDAIVKWFGWQIGDIIVIERYLFDVNVLSKKMITKRLVTMETEVTQKIK